MAKTVAWLRQLSSGEISISLLSPHPLQAGKEVIIGRDPSCTLALDAYQYEGVSRRHALIRPSRHSSSSLWEVVDQKSANGTYVNGNLITQPQILQSGDRIRLGEAGPEFSIEYSSSAVSTIPLKPGQNPQNLSSIAPPPLVTPVNLSTSPTPQPLSPTDGKTATSPSLTQLIPILSTGKDLKQKAFLIPASLTVISVILMFVFIGSFKVFSVILAFYIAGIAYYFIYQLCGKSKPWWLLMGSGIGTMLLLYTPVWILIASLFRELLPGDVFALSTEASFITHFITHFFGAGMAEELLKAIPIFIALYWGTLSSPSWRGKIGVEEPLDGILIGTASAVGFTLIETLDQYVPNIVDAAGEVVGLQLLIPRILGSVAGHMAYSGYLGYFIGLSVLKPQKACLILLIGYLSSSALHGLWNASSSIPYGLVISAIVGIISYAFLAAAILKARKLSPTRSQNFATQFVQK